MTMCLVLVCSFELLKGAVGWILIRNTCCWWVSGAKAKIEIRSCHHHSAERIVSRLCRDFIPFHTLKLIGNGTYIWLHLPHKQFLKRAILNSLEMDYLETHQSLSLDDSHGHHIWVKYMVDIGWSALITVNRGKILKKLSDIWHKIM